MSAISRGLQSFHHIKSSEPAFESSAADTAVLIALESTAVTRQWLPPGASGKAVRIASKAADDFYVLFGTSDIVATTTASVQVLGGTVETFMMPANVSHVSVVASTLVTVNFTLGYGQ
jgi:hypothetical protein